MFHIEYGDWRRQVGGPYFTRSNFRRVCSQRTGKPLVQLGVCDTALPKYVWFLLKTSGNKHLPEKIIAV